MAPLARGLLRQRPSHSPNVSRSSMLLCKFSSSALSKITAGSSRWVPLSPHCACWISDIHNSVSGGSVDSKFSTLNHLK